jgi:hypothetical protein
MLKITQVTTATKPNMKTKSIISTLCALLFTLGYTATAQPSVEEHVAKLKAGLATSQAALKKYEWIETTVVSLKGEEKARKLNRCYYGADGGITKVPMATPPPPERKRGLRGRIIENKKEEMTDYMQQAVALVKSYVPPNPAAIQAAKDAGKVSVEILKPGKRVRLNFRDYQKPGDTLGIEIDVTNNHLLSLTVKTYLEDAKDAVNLDAKFAQLTDGTSYADAITLNATAKNVKVAVDNSGYRKTN